MKRLILSTVCMLLCSTGLWAQTLVDGIYYNFDENTQTATVTNKIGDSSGSNSYSGSITIPSTVAYNGTSYSVTSIGTYAFYRCTGLTNITIPNSVTSIGSSAFSGCTGLTSVTIPNGVTSIGNSAFKNCSMMTNITIGESVTNIGESAFEDCGSLANVTIPNSVTSIGNNAFRDCGSLTNITIGESVTSIGKRAFENCSRVTSIMIPNSVTSIGEGAFENCSSLTNVTIGESVISISSTAFHYCNGLKSIIWNAKNYPSDSYYSPFRDSKTQITKLVIGENVTSIPSYLCHEMSGLKSIVIPNSVTSIGSYAFDECRLSSIIIPNSVTSIGDNAFYKCTGLKEVINKSALNITKGSTDNGYVAYYADIVCNGGKTVIGDFIFSDQDKTLVKYTGNGGDITLPENFNGDGYSIGADVFSGNTTLASVTIPSGVTSIGSSAFYNCTGLKEVINKSELNITKGSTTNGYVAYYADIVCNGGKTVIGDFIFSDQDKTLVKYTGNGGNVTLPEDFNGGNYSIGANVFSGNTALTNITIPSSVTSIGSSAFSGCSGLLNINVSEDNENYTSIDGVLYNKDKNVIIKCPQGKTNIMIPNNVTGVGSSAFYGCSNIETADINSQAALNAISFTNKLTNITLGDNITSIGTKFRGLTGLTSIAIGDGVTDIESYAFENCSELAMVTLGNGVTNMGSHVFDGTAWFNNQPDGLVYAGKVAYEYKGQKPNAGTSIVIKDGTLAIANFAFDHCTGMTSITIPNSVINIGAYAFMDCGGLTSIEIPNSVTSIGSSAFTDCTGLTSVTIPSSVTSIGRSVFNGCSGLTIVTIGEGVTSIGYEAFYNCSGLTSVTIPNSVTSIGNRAFYDCSNIETADINSQAAFDAITFTDKLTSINLGSSISSVKSSKFKNCTSLTSINVSCENYDYLKEALNQYAAILHSDCAFVVATNVNNENYGTVTNGGTFSNETIQITATPNEHYHFVKWNDGNTDNPRTVQVTQDSTFVAVFAIDEHNVTLSKNISAAGTVTGDGNYEYGTNITLTAIPNAHYLFVNWSDGDTENPRTVKVTQDSTFAAIFEIDEHNVIISKNLSAGGTVAGEGVYKHGTSITLTATPSEHYHFVKWNDGSTQNPRTVQVTQDSTFTAIFAIDEHNVTLSKNISAAGTVTGDGVYEYGTNITLTATPNEGYRFKGWSDGAIGKSRELTVTKDIDLIANFVPLYTLKTLASASQGSVSGGGIYEDGEIATLVANAKPGYVFAQWADGNDENPRYVTVDGNKTYTAYFIEGEQDKYMITWKNWDGRVIKTSEVSYGEVPAFDGEKPTRPDEAGYKFTFSGWSPTIAAASQNAEYTANYIQTATEAEKTTIGDEGTVNITTTDNTALFTWPENASADTYTLTITRNDEVFCSLTFDGQGRLINLNFPNLRASAEGYQFTVTGLNSGTDYAYDLKAKNGAATVNEYTGEFKTSGDAATAASETEESIVETARYDINGRPLTAPVKGVNIVKYSDGSFEKEFVR